MGIITYLKIITMIQTYNMFVSLMEQLMFPHLGKRDQYLLSMSVPVDYLPMQK